MSRSSSHKVPSKSKNIKIKISPPQSSADLFGTLSHTYIQVLLYPDQRLVESEPILENLGMRKKCTLDETPSPKQDTLIHNKGQFENPQRRKLYTQAVTQTHNQNRNLAAALPDIFRAWR